MIVIKILRPRLFFVVFFSDLHSSLNFFNAVWYKANWSVEFTDLHTKLFFLMWECPYTYMWAKDKSWWHSARDHHHAGAGKPLFCTMRGGAAAGLESPGIRHPSKLWMLDTTHKNIKVRWTIVSHRSSKGENVDLYIYISTFDILD